jgi:bifunctional NMN adenylyltransferase/nudix hydrolase
VLLTVRRGRLSVLLVERANHPFRGMWALPGGFVEQNERLRDAAVRELAEETRLPIPSGELRSAIVDVAVFDDPERSVRGRTITHGFFFDLKERELPAVAGADDAAEARWFHIGSICDMETEIFEDHIYIMNRFLKILGAHAQGASADREPLLVGFV